MSDMSQVRIGRRLKWFREQRELTQKSVCATMGWKDHQTLSEIEMGKRRLAPDELVRLAGLFVVELDELLDPFRLVGEGEFSFRAQDVEAGAIDEFAQKARRWIATFRELGRISNVPQVRLGQKLELTLASSYEDAEESAATLGRDWKLGAVPAEKLEQAIERYLGTLILYVDAPRGLSGAASTLPGLHTILVNRTEAPSRRAFDLAHELFHILTWDAMPPSRIESWEPRRTKGNRAEQLANCFASALLMPSTVIRNRWDKRGSTDAAAWILATAIRMRVSPTALQWRLVNLDLMPESHLRPLVGDIGEDLAPTPPLFGRRFVERVHTAVESGHLSVRRAASLLDVSVSRFGELCRLHELPLSCEP